MRDLARKSLRWPRHLYCSLLQRSGAGDAGGPGSCGSASIPMIRGSMTSSLDCGQELRATLGEAAPEQERYVNVRVHVSDQARMYHARLGQNCSRL